MNFFVLLRNAEETSGDAQPEFEHETRFIPVEGTASGAAPRCELCGRHVGALPLLPPFRMELETWGIGFGDIAFGPGDDLLVTRHFANLFQELGLSGLQGFEPVLITRVRKHSLNKDRLPDYVHVTVAKSNAAIDASKSELEIVGPAPCTACRLSNGIKRAKRLIIESGTWSGEDIFRARGLPGKIFASQRFAVFCTEYKIKNAVLVPCEEFSFDHYPWERRVNQP